MSTGERRFPRLPARKRRLHRNARGEDLQQEARARSSAPEEADRPPANPKPAARIYAFAVFFLMLGAALIVIGGHDAALARSTLGVTAASALLLLIGSFLWGAAWQLNRLCRHESWMSGTRPACHPVVLVAFLITLLFGVYALFSALGTLGPQRYPVVAAALTIVAAAVLGLFFFGRDVKLTLPRVGGAVALALLGTTIGAWEFWYQNQYIPSHAGGAVALRAQLHRTSGKGAFDVIRATLDYETVGGKSVSVIGSVYTLTGSTVVKCPRAATVHRVGDYFEGFLLDPQRIRFMADVLEETPTVLAAGKFIADGKQLDPNVLANREFMFFVPRREYQLLRFRAQLFAIPASIRLSQRTPPEYVLAGDNELYGYWHIDDDSWLHDLIFGRERWLVMRYELVDPANTADRQKPAKAAPVTQVLHVLARFPNPTWSEGRPSPEATKDLFEQPQAINAQEPGDANEPFADSELPLQKVAETCQVKRR